MEETQTFFRCLYCSTKYRVVRVAESGGPHDKKVFCQHCLRRLPQRKATFTLIYILIARPNEQTSNNGIWLQNVFD